MTRVFASEEGIPTKKNPISFIIEYKNFDANSKYQIRATVNSDGGTATASRQVQKKHGFYLGKTGLVIKPPNGTSKGATIEYRVVLLENGTIVDSNEGHIFDYEEALD